MRPTSEIPQFEHPTSETGVPLVTAADVRAAPREVHIVSGEAPQVADVPVGEPCLWPVTPEVSWDGAHDVIRAQRPAEVVDTTDNEALQ